MQIELVGAISESRPVGNRSSLLQLIFGTYNQYFTHPLMSYRLLNNNICSIIEDMSNNEDDFVSLVRIPRKWFNLFVGIFLTLIITNTLLELFTDWKWELLGDTILTRSAVLMTLLVGWFFIFAHIWEGIMLGYARIFKDRVFAEGKAEGIAEGKAAGKAEQHRIFVEWYRRRIQAEKDGREFSEPLPTPEDALESDET